MNLLNTLIVVFICSGALSATAGNFVVDKDISVVSATMHASPSHDFTSVVTEYTYDIQINPQTLEIERALCSFAFTALDSGKKSRDKKMRKWIDTPSHPSAKFEMTRIDSDTGTLIATGTFTMHGMSKSIDIPITIERKGSVITIEGATEIDYRDWRLPQIRLLFFSVDPVLKPSFRLVGTLESK